MRSRAWLYTAALAAAAVQMFPMQTPVSAQSGPGIVISELRFRGPGGPGDEFIELYNAGSSDVDISGWTIRASNNNLVPSFAVRATVGDGVVMKPGCYFLAANVAAGGYTGERDLGFTIAYGDNGGAAVFNRQGQSIDQVGLGTVPAAYGEGTRLPMQTDGSTSYERRAGNGSLHQDTNDNLADFEAISPATPKSSRSACAQQTYYPHEVQGAGAVSPRLGLSLAVRGVVTARTSSGFFLQTEPGNEDDDDETSEGLFVASPSSMAQPGRVLHVAGTVAEAASRTQLQSITSAIDLGIADLPAAVSLTSAEVAAADRLERFEGMRVNAAALTAVSATLLDGSFFAVLDGVARPFREPGIEAGAPPVTCSMAPCEFDTYDGNLERLRVDSDGVAGTTAVHLSTGASMSNVVGVLDHADGTYALLPDDTLSPSGGMAMTAAPAAAAKQFSIASLNLGDATLFTEESRLAKASLMIRNVLNLPDVLAVQNADRAVLTDLAQRIDADEQSGGRPAVHHAAALDTVLGESSRVTIVASEVVGAGVMLVDPADGSEHPVFDRPSAMLRAVIGGGALALPQTLTVIAHDLRSRDDVAADGAIGERARALRHAQAEFLANYVQNRQVNDPNEAIVSVGNYNAFQFNDGYVDTLGTMAGAPAPGNQVVLASPDLVSPDLVNLLGSLPAPEQYSSVDRGSAQALDHVLVTSNLAPQFQHLSFVRVNADFPEALRNVAASAGGLSDRDPVVAYFSFPPDVSAPVFDVAPQDVVEEATSDSGAAVNYAAPTATDNLDDVVTVSCSPVSGSVFPLGNTGVQCSAEDVAGNAASASFTVSVVPPVLGRMHGGGQVTTDTQRVAFAFEVRESENYVERGWLMLHVQDGSGRPDRMLGASVFDVRFSSRRDHVSFSGHGSWNGQPGYRFEVSATDRGEPGNGVDVFEVVVTGPTGEVVESVSGVLSAGNLQAR